MNSITTSNFTLTVYKERGLNIAITRSFLIKSLLYLYFCITHPIQAFEMIPLGKQGQQNAAE